MISLGAKVGSKCKLKNSYNSLNYRVFPYVVGVINMKSRSGLAWFLLGIDSSCTILSAAAGLGGRVVRG